MKIIEDFVGKVIATRGTGAATEHSYRPALLDLFNALEEGVVALNEPKRVGCGAPDFIIQRGEIAIGHVEAKDIGVGLRALKDRNKEQQDRYRKALPNLIYTNCFDWDFYRDGELIASAGIADCRETIRPKPDQYEPLANLLRDFIAQRPRTIVSPRVLAEMMAGKAQLIKDILRNTLRADENLETELTGQFRAFREHLIHDIIPEDFADIYAETIAYGMFAARLHDTSLETFSRQEALDLLPKTNPFLRSLFGFIAGVELDDRIAWIIDELAAVFQAADVAEIMKGFGRLTGRNDPFLHFYETFLAAYNPAKRKARGVWYTPEPVVNFIVRAVDEVLRTEFGLPDGLADTSKVAIDFDTGQNRGKGGQKPSRRSKEVHRVQILDPATGTGTFLAEAIKQIAPKVKDVAPGMWSKYVETELIPRLHGFELLMASYAMCHMKLDMILNELGYEPADNPPRLSVYLTNSLEEGEREVRDLFMTQWLTREAREANTIKRDMPIMCVIGNPPYLGEGGKSTGWLGTLMDDYKKEPGGKVKLKERNPKWLNDLYVKFIRLSSHLIERNGEGVLGFITNHGYLDNPTFRGMRWHLLKTFDKIWVLDLHGNAKKKEVTPEGKPDRNVFDIQQGVAIIIGVKKKDGGKELAEVMQGDLWGERNDKYDWLVESDLSKFNRVLHPQGPWFIFEPYDNVKANLYNQWFSVTEFFRVGGTGVVTKRDKLTIHITKEGVVGAVTDMSTLSEEMVRNKYKIPKDVRDWRYPWALDDLKENASNYIVAPISYRPFDNRFIYYSGRSRGFVGWPVEKIMCHFIRGKNLGLATARSNKNPIPDHFFVVDRMMETKCAESSTQSAVFPLYLYPDKQDLDPTRRVNFDPKLHKKLQKLAKHPEHGAPDEVAIFDYIYGVLHCPAYRETYAEFLKIDFPRIPWPPSPDEFWDISAKGARLRKLHLMDPAAIGPTPFPFMGEGDSVIDKPRFEDGKIWINKTQYFDNAPEVSWGFYIGGYQPARKWLKDRKGRALGFEDVKHYQRILKILAETDRIMAEITMTLNA